ncbi:family 3 glycoside hydrolase [Aureobasidium sp. EXF-8845]|nr:family 3 glycoside hydrolase [Aureobasidium sp. EXF-8845]KAI4858017.1 family 3 glycoside hydrolase [Aureobasidium sp. EXF-8846]
MVIRNLPELIACMSLDQKISLLAGKNFWETQEIPELGIPSLKLSDGPNGARGAAFSGGTTAACFPASVSLAATFDPKLAYRIGKALAEETLTKGANVLLGPTACPHRHPLGGRNFESFSEDPLLAGRLAAQYIHGVQDQGVGATLKHFAVNEQETKRFAINAIVSEKALREIYLRPFEIAIKEAKPWALMTSYNSINGKHADTNDFLLQKILRQEWGWNGLCMSDWGGTNSTAESLKAGLALEMPGTARYYPERPVKAAIAAGKLSEDVIDKRVNEVLNLIALTGKFDKPQSSAERAVVNPEHSKLIRDAGARGIVLLKNENGILPLRPGKIKRIAVLGLAKQCLAHGGGSASVNTHYKISPYEALEEVFHADTELLYAEGAHLHRTLPVLSEHILDLHGAAGLTMTRYNLENPDKIDSVTAVRSSRYMSLGQAPSSKVTIEGTYTPEESGHHKLELSSIGVATLCIDDELVMSTQGSTVDPVSFLQGNAEGQRVGFSFKQGTSYNVKVDLKLSADTSGFLLLQGVMGVSLGLMEQAKAEEDLLTPAVDAAKNSDIAIVFVGNTNAWESEGRDMESMNLPANGSQDRLISAVAEVNPNTIVVNSTGVPIAMPWLPEVKALVQTWFPGQEAGNAIVDILTGAVNPSGRLPVTFPRRLEDTPAYGNFPGDIDRLEVSYTEGSFIGYRHYDHSPETVLFPFGYGLSYTAFAFDKATLTTSPRTTCGESAPQYVATINVTNTGDVSGSEIIQVYMTPPPTTTGTRTQRKLVGFEKLELQPGETKTAHVAFKQTEFAEWDEDNSRWSVAGGEHLVELSTSAARADVKATFTIMIEEDCVTSKW